MADDTVPDEDTVSEGTASEEPVFSISAKARARVIEMREDEDSPASLALWVEVLGARGPDLGYDLYFQALDESGPDDVVLGHDDLSVVIPSGSIEMLRGAELDMSRDLLNPGMVVNNPNQPPAPSSPSLGEPPAELTGDAADKIAQVLEQQINPSIAAHGGRAELVAVEGDIVYVRLSGGCPG